LIAVIFSGLRKSGRTDLEAIEMATRASMHQAGATALKHLLSSAPPAEAEREIACPCGHKARYLEMRPKQVLTVVGSVAIERAYYLCRHCHSGQCPRDQELDVESGPCSPGVRRLMAVVGSESPFQRGCDQLQLLADLDVPAKAIERQAEAIGADIAKQEQDKMGRAIQLELPQILDPNVPKLYIEMDGTGIPVVNAETEGRAGKREGQSAHTREVKLACVFTQTKCDDKGRPIRDEASTTYVGAIETAEAFGPRVYIEAWERGWSRAAIKVVLADGSIWIWNIADQHFPGAIQIVDIYHARQHIWGLAAKLFPDDQKQKNRWARKLIRKLNAGSIKSLIAELRAFPGLSQELQATLHTEADYFERNAERMRYPKFRKMGLFVGSGVIEAGCKTVIGSRLKQSGMFWTVRGANAIIALRCNRLSGKFEGN
jgi:hypothetical protein